MGGNLLWKDGDMTFGIVVGSGMLRGAVWQSVSEGGRNFCETVGIVAQAGMVAEGNF